jgi:hypothetical protein
MLRLEGRQVRRGVSARKILQPSENKTGIDGLGRTQLPGINRKTGKTPERAKAHL